MKRSRATSTQHIMRGIACIAVALQASCSAVYPPLPPPANHVPIRALAVVASTQPIEVKIKGSEKQGDSAFGRCLSGLGGGGCSGDFCGAALLIVFSVCGVVGVVGAMTPPTETPPKSDDALSESLKNAVALDLNEKLRAQTISAAKMRGTPLSSNSDAGTTPIADATLEVGVTQITLSRARAETPISLSLIAGARVERAGDTASGATKSYFYSAGRHTLDEWVADGGRRLRESVQQAVSALGEHIHDYALFHYPLPDRAPQLSGFLAATFGLAPLDPKPRGTTITDDAISRRFAWPEVKSLQPTLRWERFPRPGDIQADTENMGRISNVRYDLVIAAEKGLSVDEIVYRRNELPVSEHFIERPLESDHRYFWSVRARFDLDGQTRFTEWGNMSFPLREGATAPSDFSYRFRTP